MMINDKYIVIFGFLLTTSLSASEPFALEIDEGVLRTYVVRAASSGSLGELRFLDGVTEQRLSPKPGQEEEFQSLCGMDCIKGSTGYGAYATHLAALITGPLALRPGADREFQILANGNAVLTLVPVS